MRAFHVAADQFTELPELPDELPPDGYLWVSSARREFELRASELQNALQRWTGGQLVDLHVTDLLNNQLPSHFDLESHTVLRLPPNPADLMLRMVNHMVDGYLGGPAQRDPGVDGRARRMADPGRRRCRARTRIVAGSLA